MKKKIILTLAILILTTFSSCSIFQSGLGNKVDLEDPKITEITSHNNGDYIAGEITLSGTFIDDIEVSKVYLTFTGQSVIEDQIKLPALLDFDSTDKKSGTWTLTVDTRERFPIDGERNLVIEIIDTSGRSTTKNLLLFVDNTKPLLMVSSPQGYRTSEFNGLLAIKGEAIDEFGLKKVELHAVDAESGNTIIETIQLDGTITWSYSFNSTEETIPSSGTFNFYISATDRAGNTSDGIYHYDDIFDRNGDKAILIDTVYQIFNGERIEGASLRKEDLEDNDIKRDYIPIIFNQEGDLPQFIFSTPDFNLSLDQNTLAANARALGMVQDDDGILPETIEIKINDYQWTAVETIGEGLSVRWSYDLSFLPEGRHELKLRATDIGQTQIESQTVAFAIDTGAPIIDVLSPYQGEYLQTTDININGTASDSDEVVKVEILYGNKDASVAANWEEVNSMSEADDQGQVSWSHRLENMPSGSLPIRLRAWDDSRAAYYNLQVNIDPDPPVIEFLSPKSSSTVVNEVLIKGSAFDNSQLAENDPILIKVGKHRSFRPPDSGTYNWQISVDTQSLTSSLHADETSDGSNVWKLPITVQATDIAGNVSTSNDYYLFIDNDLDKPSISIISPESGQTTGGAVLISGTSFDNNEVHHIEMAIDLNGDGDFADTEDLDNDWSYTSEFENESQWYPVSGTTQWKKILNSNGNLYASGEETIRKLQIRVRAVDTKDGINPDVEGNYQEIILYLDKTIPRVEQIQIGFDENSDGNVAQEESRSDYSSAMFVNNIIQLEADIIDDKEVSSVSVSFDGGINYVDLLTDGIIQDPARISANSSNTLEDEYNLHIQMDTDQLDLYDTSSGDAASASFYFRIKVIDSSNYQTLSYVNLGVDNQKPTASWDASGADPQNIYGETARVQGTALDEGIINGVKSVHVYFEDPQNSNKVLRPSNGSSVSSETRDFGSGAVLFPESQLDKLLINSSSELGEDSRGDGDGVNESISQEGSIYKWWAEFNSTHFPDGSLTVHFVVFDLAGNANHYMQSILIANNKPQIDSVTVGYDIDKDNSVSSAERFAYTGSFKASNRLYYNITGSDNGSIISYQVFKGENLIASNESGTIDISTWDEGSHSLSLKITDNDGVSYAENLIFEVENSDSENPQITIASLNTSSVLDFNGDPQGHIELTSNPSYYFDGEDPDVSGTVILEGTCYDNKGIDSITLTLDLNGDGVNENITVAQWGASQLSSSDSRFVIDSQSLNSSGHSVSWHFSWQTWTIEHAVQKNASPLFTVTDHTPRSKSASIQVDVVPYITSVSTHTGGIKDNNVRSSTGAYSIRQNVLTADDLITISGYNLNQITNGVRVCNSSYKSGLDGSSLQGNMLTIESTSDHGLLDYTWIKVRKDSAYSGYLAVVCGDPTNPVPSWNNLNDNSLSENQEFSELLKNNQLNDDRYLNFFIVKETGYTNGYYPSMIMEGDNPVFSYCEDNSGETRRGNTAAAIETIGTGWYHRMTDLALDSLGNYYQVSVHDAFGSDSYGHMTLFYNSFNSSVYPYGSADSRSTGDTGVINNNALALESIAKDSVKLNRYHYPKLRVRSADADTSQIYLLYYDDNGGKLLLRTFQIGANTDAATEYDMSVGVKTNQLETFGTNTASGAQEINTTASKYFDFAIASDGTLIIVYYDESQKKLMKTHNSSPVNSDGLYNTGSSFTTPLALDEEYIGAYVSMEIDDSDHIHIACYDAQDANLRYIYLPDYSSTSPQAVTVESHNSVGLWTDIKIKSGSSVPYIAYYNNSENGTLDSLKLSFYNGDPVSSLNPGVDENGYVTGHWECMTAPALDVPQGGLPQFNHLCLDFNTAGKPVIGYLADDLEYTVLQGEN